MRKQFAKICQEGASNERRAASALVEAIDECRDEGVNPRQDPSVFLILHQLAFLLTGHDIAVGDEDLSLRWHAAMKEIEQ